MLAQSGRSEQRKRLLPAQTMVYYAMALALFSEGSYEEVMRNLVEGLDWSAGWRGGWQVPSKVAISKARARLGAEPLRSLYEQAARPLATPKSEGAFCGGLRLMAIDGTTLDLADTAANEAAFGRPGSGRGEGRGAYPQLRAVGLAECGTHTITASRWGRSSAARAASPRNYGARWSRACCCSPIAASGASRRSKRRRQAAQSCSGASARA